MSIWSYLELLELSGAIWRYLAPPGAILKSSFQLLCHIILYLFTILMGFRPYVLLHTHTCLSGAIWSYLELSGATWLYLELPGAIPSYLELSGAIWTYLA